MRLGLAGLVTVSLVGVLLIADPSILREQASGFYFYRRGPCGCRPYLLEVPK